MTYLITLNHSYLYTTDDEEWISGNALGTLPGESPYNSHIVTRHVGQVNVLEQRGYMLSVGDFPGNVPITFPANPI